MLMCDVAEKFYFHDPPPQHPPKVLLELCVFAPICCDGVICCAVQYFSSLLCFVGNIRQY